MGCQSLTADGRCKHHMPAKCPVEKVWREFFGDMEMCEPVRQDLLKRGLLQ